MHSLPSTQDEKALRFARSCGKHVVSLGWIDKTPPVRSRANTGSGFPCNVSCSLIEVENRWFLVTAGHVLQDIEQARLAGQLLTDWHLEDGVSSPGELVDAIPFDFDHAEKGSIVRTEGIDIGYIYLREHYVRYLMAGNKCAISEDGWRIDFEGEFDNYYLLGVPNETLEVRENSTFIRVGKNYTLVPIDRISEAPDFMRTYLPRFYGRIPPLVFDSGSTVEDIAGMSGGPILAFRRTSTGTSRYWVIAIQSAWDRSTRTIAACPLMPFAESLKRRILESDTSTPIDKSATDVQRE